MKIRLQGSIRHRLVVCKIVGLLLTLLSYCHGECCLASESLPQDRPRAGNEGSMISADELPKLQAEAMHGSGESASRLSSYYFSVTLNGDEGARWLTIAAENGYAVAEYSLGARLSDNDSELDKVRACFWLQKAKMHGAEQINRLAEQKLAMHSRYCGENS